jgi:integrase
VYGDSKREIPADPIARVKLSKLSKAQMSAYRARVLEYNSDRSSFNRNVTNLRAALNLALADGKLATDLAFRNALRPFSDEEMEAQCERRRTLVLNAKNRRKLIEGASGEARAFFEALAILPMRPGEIAALRVEHFDAREGTLHIPPGKTKARNVPLSKDAISLFKQCAKNKLPSAWLISRADGSQWKKEAWRDEAKAAAKKAKLPRATVAYTLRHSLITELVIGGSDLFTIAKLAGTSVRMIEKHYGHLQSEHARKVLETLALAH